MTELTGRGTQEFFFMIPPNQEVASPYERSSPAVRNDAKPSRLGRIAQNRLPKNSFVCSEEILQDTKYWSTASF
jgi:hypothetical protein